jgi:acetyl-CoA acetyltransferase
MGSDASYKPALTFTPDYKNDFDVGYPLLHQGYSADIIATKYNISRLEMEEFAVKSHKQCWDAIQKGHFKDQLVPIKVFLQFKLI